MRFKHILVVINPQKDDQVAFNKAIILSERLGSSITVLVRKKHAVPKLLNTLSKKLEAAEIKGISIALEISDENTLLRSIIRTQHDNGFNLIIKEPHTVTLSDHVFLSDDWKLLRSSRCPVLMVHADNQWDDGCPVLLCVNANPTDREHEALNTQILNTGRFLAKIGNGQCNLVSAYPSVMQNVDGKKQSPTFLETQYRTACLEMLNNDDIPDNQIHIDQGPPELLIPEIADQIQAKLVVLGTVARSGLQGVFLGNTAEQVLSRLKTDVLIISPE